MSGAEFKQLTAGCVGYGAGNLGVGKLLVENIFNVVLLYIIGNFGNRSGAWLDIGCAGSIYRFIIEIICIGKVGIGESSAENNRPLACILNGLRKFPVKL